MQRKTEKFYLAGNAEPQLGINTFFEPKTFLEQELKGSSFNLINNFGVTISAACQRRF